MTTPTQPATSPLTDAVIEAAVDNAIAEARRHDTSPKAVIGTAPPIPQPGRPPMSQRAVDASVLMLSAGAASLPIGGMASLVVYTIGQTDPTSLAIAASAPAAIALPILALARLLSGAKHVVPDIHHHHYTGTVDQRTVTSSTRGLWAKTNNTQ